MVLDAQGNFIAITAVPALRAKHDGAACPMGARLYQRFVTIRLAVHGVERDLRAQGKRGLPLLNRTTEGRPALQGPCPTDAP